MGLIDILIIIGLLSGGSIGFRNGVIKQGVILLGTIICLILAWTFKNLIANILTFNLPFFSFNGMTSLNIVLYQLISFLLLMMIFSFILFFAIKLAGGIEKILKFTIVLSIPSKILGFILGVLEALVIIFICLFILKGTVINKNIKLIDNSKYAPVILEKMPGLSNISKNMNESLNDIYTITKTYDSDNKIKFNKQVTKTLVKHKVIDDEYLNKLREKGKINY